jgi:hypothetical protein
VNERVCDLSKALVFPLQVMIAALSALDVGQEVTVTGGEGQGDTGSVAPAVPDITPPGDGDDGSHALTTACDEMVRGLPSQQTLQTPIEPVELSRGDALTWQP